MLFVADTFAGWLIGQVADAGRKRLGDWLLGSDQQRALEQAATAAIQATARQLRPEPTASDDPRGADYLARVIDQVFQAPTPAESLANHPTLLQGLQAGVATRLAVLDDAHLTGTGQSSAALLRVPGPALAELLTSHLLRELVARGVTGGPLAPLATQLNHDLTHLQGQQNSAALVRLTNEVQATLARLDKRDQAARSILVRTRPPLGRPVQELTDPFTLEVHRAIDVPGRTTRLPALPAYVQRDHDRQLQAIVKRAADGRSAAAVLVGGSSTGKTRACWEAVQGLPAEWRLWHPIDPSRPEAAADALPAIGPRTVIWLNEAQYYLLTSASQLGERVAAGLRELLRDPARSPVLLLGTIWPEYWAILTTPPAPGQQDDPHTQARALLTGTDIPVPDAFTGPALQAAQAAAKADPRLAEAAAHAEDGRITQFLAGAPALLERYRNAPAAAKALIEAAMDARRLGHGMHLSAGLLEAATPGYLADQQWDSLPDDWLEQAVAYCAAPCRGAIGALTGVRPRPGQPAPAQAHYRLADYLEQTGRSTRRAVLPPAALWDVLLQYADERELLRIAEEARERSLYRHAVGLYRRAAETGDPGALGQAARLLERVGRTDEAIAWYQRAAETSDRDALEQATWLLEDAGRVDEAASWLESCAADIKDPLALRQAAELLERAHRLDEAIAWYQRAAESGDHYALRRAAGLLERAGRIEEAIGLYRRAVKSGDSFPLRQAAELLERVGRIDEAIDFYQRAAETGDDDALGQAAELLKRAGRIDQAIAWLQSRAAETSDPNALGQAAELLERVGRIDEAIACYQRAAEAGNLLALRQAVRLLEDAGHIDRVISWLQSRTTESGDENALWQAAELLERAGRIDEAISFYLRAETGVYDALWRAASLLEDAGRIEEAISLYQRAAETDDYDDLRRRVKLLEEAGQPDEAISWLQTGHYDAVRRAAELLERAGRTNQAISWLQSRAAENGDNDALWRAAELLERAGRIDEAISLYQRAADTYPLALWQAIELLKRADRTDEAIDWLQTRAAETGDPLALQEAAGLLEDAGRIDEAIRWLQSRSAGTRDHNALRRVAELLERASRIDEAIDFYQRAAEIGDHDALRRATEILEDAGRIDEATSWLQSRTAETGDHNALRRVAELLERAGRIDEAISWLQTRAAETGDDDALWRVAELLERAGRIDEAINFYQRAAEDGDHDALENAAGLLEDSGRTDEAISLYLRAAETGDPLALRQAAGLLEDSGRTDEAISLYLRAAETGDPLALRQAAGLLERIRRTDQAALLRQYGLEPGGHVANEWH